MKNNLMKTNEPLRRFVLLYVCGSCKVHKYVL